MEKISVHKIWIMSSYIITTGLYEPLVCPVKLLFDTSHFGELFEAGKIVQHNFSQFWTVFPSFGREKLGKTGLSQFIPFWTGKTGFGREKPNPVAALCYIRSCYVRKYYNDQTELNSSCDCHNKLTIILKRYESRNIKILCAFNGLKLTLTSGCCWMTRVLMSGYISSLGGVSKTLMSS